MTLAFGLNHAPRLGRLLLALGLGAAGLLPATAHGGDSSPLRDALKEMFSGSQKVKKLRRTPDAAAEKRIALALGLENLRRKEFSFYLGITDGKTDGYAIVLDVMGKYQPITFVVGLDAAGKVKMVEILKYREPVGGEVRDSRFRKQYVGKDPDDPIQVGRDIKNISGATISCRAVSHGVKKAVLLVDEIFISPAKAAADEKAPSEKGRGDGKGEKPETPGGKKRPPADKPHPGTKSPRGE